MEEDTEYQVQVPVVGGQSPKGGELPAGTAECKEPQHGPTI